MFRIRTLLFALVVAGGSEVARADLWSYADLDYALGRYVTPAGLVDYEGLSADRQRLSRFVESLAQTSPENRPELFPTEATRLAYWMNAYNALMLARVVEAWPIGSVTEIRPLYGVFWIERHVVGGKRWTLRGLENKIIRGRFGDPRIHFAINCASVGCPALPMRAWRPETLDEDLDAAARRFVADPSKVRLDEATGVIYLSRIFEWFDGDFTAWLEKRGTRPVNGVVDYVLRYLPANSGDRLDAADLRIQWLDYDWTVNRSSANVGDSEGR